MITRKVRCLGWGRTTARSCRSELTFNSPRITNFILRVSFTGRTEWLRTVVHPVAGIQLFEIWEALLWTEFRVGGGSNDAAAAGGDDSVWRKPSWYGIVTYLVKKLPVLHGAQNFIILRQLTAFLTIRFVIRTVAYIVPVKQLCNILQPFFFYHEVDLLAPCYACVPPVLVASPWCLIAVAIMYWQPGFISGRFLLYPQSEDAPGIGDKRTRINNVVVDDGYDDYDRYDGGGGLDVNDGNGTNGNVGHTGRNLWLLKQIEP